MPGRCLPVPWRAAEQPPLPPPANPPAHPDPVGSVLEGPALLEPGIVAPERLAWSEPVDSVQESPAQPEPEVDARERPVQPKLKVRAREGPSLADLAHKLDLLSFHQRPVCGGVLHAGYL